jgi:redox-sensitive bicupin YhaK (pirin superfamily)
VINEDWIAPAKGFDTHGHRDMEIVTYVLSGSLEHKDSLGTGSIIRPGEIQRMTAGTGIQHSEYNPSLTDPTRLLQIWILPETEGLAPSYEQKKTQVSDMPGTLQLIASRQSKDHSVTIHQDVDLYAGLLPTGTKVVYSLTKPYAWIQIAQGQISLNEKILKAGDGVAVAEEKELQIQALETADILLFELS